MTENNTQTTVRLGPQGRIVIPAKLRQLLAVEPGDTLIARCQDGQLVLEKAETIKRRLKTRFAHIPKETSLADELLAERYEEAERETSE
jgi:AbrB family looped-hinge helix DNA binding protein